MRLFGLLHLLGQASLRMEQALWPMHSLEPFLLLLSSVFVPLYGVILGRLALGGSNLALADKKVDWLASGLWLMGIACYHLLANVAPQWGSALPTLAITFSLAWLTRPSMPHSQDASPRAQNRG